jgi:hypothetical protein
MGNSKSASAKKKQRLAISRKSPVNESNLAESQLDLDTGPDSSSEPLGVDDAPSPETSVDQNPRPKIRIPAKPTKKSTSSKRKPTEEISEDSVQST